MQNPDELLPLVTSILDRIEEDRSALEGWRQTEDGQKVIQYVVQIGKYNTNLGEGKEISIGDRLDRALLEEVRDLLRSQLSSQAVDINWQQVSRLLLEQQVQRLTSNPLTHSEGIAYQTDQVYVPLGLVERERQSRRGEDVLPEEGSRLYEETEITRRFEHEEFLEQVLGQGHSPRSGGRRLAIIGEPGAGKTTLLQQIAHWISENIDSSIVIWISLADLQGELLENYLLGRWLQAAVQHQGIAEASTQIKDAFVAQFQQGRVWLLPDGVDEMQVLSGTPLSEIERQVREGGLLSQARIALTCRLNLWDGNRHALDTFDTYRTLEFSYPDQVEQFIRRWFEALADTQTKKAAKLCAALRTPGKERIRDLVKNPLRLTLLCFNWYLGEGDLPQTKAGLYEQFVEDFYEWKYKQYPITFEQQQELNASLGKLSQEAIDCEETRFRLRQDFVSKFLGDLNETGSLFWLALKLGWLNQVGLDLKNKRKRVYAFFHPTFQEYFAALEIKEWNFFFNQNLKEITKGSYRIFQAKWKEVILLWLGCFHADENNNGKVEFIRKLTQFKDKCGGFYFSQAYFLAAQGVTEIEEFDLQFEIIDRMIDFTLNYHQVGRVISRESKLTLQQIEHVFVEKILLKKYNSISRVQEILKLIYQWNKFNNNSNERLEPQKVDGYSFSEEDLEYMQHLPYHLVEASMIDELFEILGDDKFLRILNRTFKDRVKRWENFGYSSKMNTDDLDSELDLAIFIANTIRGTKDMVFLSNACLDLRLIVQGDNHSKIVPILRKNFEESDAETKEIYFMMLWDCANKMSYLAFFKAWNQTF